MAEKCYISRELYFEPMLIMENTMAEARDFLPKDKIADFCRRWNFVEFSLFGSVLRSDFGPDSDIDILVDFAPDAAWTLLDHVEMQEELEQFLGRKVDLVSRRGIERSRNLLRRDTILCSSKVFCAAT
jgi:predicted nucleotidyltransferase